MFKLSTFVMYFESLINFEVILCDNVLLYIIEQAVSYLIDLFFSYFTFCDEHEQTIYQRLEY